jgi:glycosyltransferase A (GT-A) superfamily protein (DUF2064 family)
MTPTAVVLLKAPRLGTVKTRLAAELGAPCALAIYRTLAERQLQAIPAGWPITVNFTPADAGQELRTWLAAIPRVPAIAYYPQPDGDLGVRIAAAFAQAFAGGAPCVLALGGDCPDLNAALLEHAANRLAPPEIDAVLGPAADGGYTAADWSRFADATPADTPNAEAVLPRPPRTLNAARWPCARAR